jgi:cytochrome c biogenesis protein
MILGCIVTFYMSHQRICVEITKSSEQSNISVSGYANKNKVGMENKISKITKRLIQLD